MVNFCRVHLVSIVIILCFNDARAGSQSGLSLCVGDTVAYRMTFVNSFQTLQKDTDIEGRQRFILYFRSVVSGVDSTEFQFDSEIDSVYIFVEGEHLIPGIFGGDSAGDTRSNETTGEEKEVLPTSATTGSQIIRKSSENDDESTAMFVSFHDAPSFFSDALRRRLYSIVPLNPSMKEEGEWTELFIDTTRVLNGELILSYRKYYETSQYIDTLGICCSRTHTWSDNGTIRGTVPFPASTMVFGNVDYTDVIYAEINSGLIIHQKARTVIDGGALLVDEGQRSFTSISVQDYSLELVEILRNKSIDR